MMWKRPAFEQAVANSLIRSQVAQARPWGDVGKFRLSKLHKPNVRLRPDSGVHNNYHVIGWKSRAVGGRQLKSNHGLDRLLWFAGPFSSSCQLCLLKAEEYYCLRMTWLIGDYTERHPSQRQECFKFNFKLWIKCISQHYRWSLSEDCKSKKRTVTGWPRSIQRKPCAKPVCYVQVFFETLVYCAAVYWRTINRMICLYDLLFLFIFLARGEVVLSVNLSLFVRESLVGKVLDLLAARVVHVARTLHLGLRSGK